MCNRTNCDQIDVRWPEVEGQAIQVESSRSGKRFRASKLGARRTQLARDPQSTIYVKLSETHQTILGWGGAFTDATALNVFNLSKPMSQKLIESYYGERGLQYNFGRVPIAGSDFSARAYSYDDVADDYDLEHWALAPEDTDYKIPMIQEAKKLTEARGEQLKLFASPWSPPVWMKTNNRWEKGHLKDDDRTWRSYSNYLMKFYQAYREKGIDFWGQTLENEPIQASVYGEYINSLEMNATEQIKFVTKYFGPALKAAGKGKDKFKLMVGDDSLIHTLSQVSDVMNDTEAAKYFSGVAFHWYNTDVYDILEQTYEAVKGKIEFVLMTEACSGNNWLSKKVDLGNWDRGDAYALDIIEDLLRHSGGWIDWNMALNKGGGPNWATNIIDAPIIVDEVKDEFLKQPMYYTLAHFSRFFRPGSMRVGTSIDTKHDIRTVAVRNDTTGHLIVVVLNRSFKDQQVSLKIDNGYKYAVALEARSIKTIVVKL